MLLAMGRLRYISPMSPLHLPYISPASPLYLPCISLHLPCISPMMGRLRGVAALLAEAPEEAMRDEMMVALRGELESAREEREDEQRERREHEPAQESRAPRTGE